MQQSFIIDVLSTLQVQAKTPKQKDFAHLEAKATIEWLITHYFPAKVRKSNLPVHVVVPTRGTIELRTTYSEASSIKDFLEKKQSFDFSSWEKGVWAALKKVTVEDLGNMNACDLIKTIPDEDCDGRGMKDLQWYEKKLAVKIVFDEETGHVLLVGDKKKLGRKVFEIRNMISHYHWRLSGTDIAFKDAMSKKGSSER